MIERIKKLISDRGLVTSKFLQEVDLPSSAISEWSKGKAKPSLDALTKIADYFGVSVDYLLGRTSIGNEINSHNTISGNNNIIGNGNCIGEKLTEQEIALIDIFGKLDVIKQAQLLSFAAELSKK